MLYDEMLVTPPQILVDCDRAGIQAMFMEQARKAVRIQAHNVAEYLFLGNEQEEWDLTKDFPQCVPPFPVTWIEWALPHKSNSGGKIVSLDSHGQRCAMLLITEETETLQKMNMTDDEKIRAVHVLASVLDPTLREKLSAMRGEVLQYNDRERQGLLSIFEKIQRRQAEVADAATFPRWMVTAFFLLSDRDIPLSLVPYETHISLLPNGQVMNIEVPGQEPTVFLSMPFSHAVTQGLMSQVFFVPLLTLSFLNCKNVTRIAHQPSEKLNTARIRRGKEPLVSYYTLEITPMKEILKREGKSDEVGLARALSLCRGHFAEYGPDFHKGKLFGKYSGRFWISQHMKGSATAGVIHKDYNVLSPTA